MHRQAFAQPTDLGGVPAEVVLLAALRRSPSWIPRLSLVAVNGDESAIGHVVCTRARVGPGHGHPVLALGPLGVLPEHQQVGVGHALMHTVIAAAEALDEALIGVLGDRAYYARFGFRPAKTMAIEAPVSTWGDHFQIRDLNPSNERLTGRFRFPAPFDEL